MTTEPGEDDPRLLAFAEVQRVGRWSDPELPDPTPVVIVECARHPRRPPVAAVYRTEQGPLFVGVRKRLGVNLGGERVDGASAVDLLAYVSEVRLPCFKCPVRHVPSDLLLDAYKSAIKRRVVTISL